MCTVNSSMHNYYCICGIVENYRLSWPNIIGFDIQVDTILLSIAIHISKFNSRYMIWFNTQTINWLTLNQKLYSTQLWTQINVQKKYWNIYKYMRNSFEKFLITGVQIKNKLEWSIFKERGIINHSFLVV